MDNTAHMMMGMDTVMGWKNWTKCIQGCKVRIWVLLLLGYESFVIQELDWFESIWNQILRKSVVGYCYSLTPVRYENIYIIKRVNKMNLKLTKSFSGTSLLLSVN